MLDSMRSAASGFLGKAIIGVLVVAFAVWGIADIFTGFGGDTVAQVGDEEIDLPTFDREFRVEVDRFSQRIGQPLTLEQARAFGVDRSALSRLVSVATLDAAAKEIGLAVGDEAVALDIMTDENLQGAFGRFDREIFRQTLRANGISEERFIEQRRKGMVREQLVDAISAGVAAPESIVDVVARFQDETRVAGYIILPPSLVGDIAEPDEETLRTFYQAGASAFTLPETRDISFMVLEPEDITQTMTISDEDLQAAYEQRRGEYDVPERREVEQVTFGSEEAAKEALAKLRSGTATEEIVKELGLTMEDIELGTVSRAEMLSPDLAEAAFSVESNSWSEPVKGPLGWSIFHVGEISPAKPSTYEEVKDDLRRKIELELAQEQIYDIQNNIEDARAGGETLADIAARYNLTLREIDGVTEDGKTRQGADVEMPEDLPNLLETAYANGVGEQIPPLATSRQGYYWVQVDAVTPAEVQPLDDVRERVLELWKETRRTAELQALAEKLAERGNAGESFEKIAGEYGRSVLATPGIGRNSRNDTFSRTAVTKLFATPEGGFTWGPVGVGDSLLLMQVKEIREPDLAKDSSRYREIAANVRDSIQADMLQVFVTGYQREIGVEVNTGLIAQVTGADVAQ
ncbi:peptidyl-prolyl cis-trans isomerase [Parvibaculum sp.]|jgi:peptidyl-prolyl cis-trans isomerase D|uniref:peptidyl-prolyl cis-trans isomerase n=1 Tax=Parvibaculum sp. TaxID=2024848 RepID=UPI0025F79CDE|nr:peptidyl-prolyl cis-trans isomerase [Parvibaculum sp.]|tara:strand:- start:4003 stop:5901 length:1899 start_codon:yes stop_codon:yes gene_type:complete